MKTNFFRKINGIIKSFGLNPIIFFWACYSILPYFIDLIRFKILNKRAGYPIKKIELTPQLMDKKKNAGETNSHYFWQDLLVAREIYKASPNKHCDIGSRIDGFIAHLATFRSITVFDIRQLNTNIPNIIFNELDLMNDIPLEYQNYTDSLSCLHTLEHFGLGRYGDKLDPSGFIVGFTQMSKILKNNGKLYLSVPIGRERVEFNAHRVFNPLTIINLIKDKFQLIKIIVIDDEYSILDFDDVSSIARICNSIEYGCGIFICEKKVLK